MTTVFYENRQEHPEFYHFTKMKELVGDRKFKSCLDVGNGDGFLASFFQESCEKITGVEGDPLKVELAKRNCPKGRFEVVNLEEFDVTGTYDFCIFSDVIYYLTSKTQQRIMQEIHSVLEEDGLLLTSRHLGKGDQELDDYLHLFEKIKTEDVFNPTSNSRWRITLWKKIKMEYSIEGSYEGEMRSIEEIKEKIEIELRKTDLNLGIINVLLWGYVRDKKIIWAVINKRIQMNGQVCDEYVLALMWLLCIEKDKEQWKTFQEWYHSIHNGSKEPDFRAEIFKSWIGKGKKVLDVGVQNGVNTNVYAKGNTLLGIDLPKVIEKFSPLYKFNHESMDIFEESDKIGDSIFDVVVAGEIIEHSLEPRKFIEIIHRILKPKGELLVSCPFEVRDWRDPLHCNFVNREFMEKIFEGRFEIVEYCDDLQKEKATVLLRARSLKNG